MKNQRLRRETFPKIFGSENEKPKFPKFSEVKINFFQKVKMEVFKTFESKNVKFAIQSGPLLIIDREINEKLNKNSNSKMTRSGVGVLNSKELIFIMVNTGTSLYEFANIFKNIGCVNALYLDGLNLAIYSPKKDIYQTDGHFGVIIGIIVDDN